MLLKSLRKSKALTQAAVRDVSSSKARLQIASDSRLLTSLPTTYCPATYCIVRGV